MVPCMGCYSYIVTTIDINFVVTYLDSNFNCSFVIAS